MEIGDKVQWVPSLDHHMDFVPWANQYAWEHTVTRAPRHAGEKGEEVVQSTSDIQKALNNQSVSRRKQFLEGLKATKPQTTYPAVVRAVEDGKVSLDITSPVGGITLHYDNVPVDPSGAPGTCKE